MRLVTGVGQAVGNILTGGPQKRAATAQIPTAPAAPTLPTRDDAAIRRAKKRALAKRLAAPGSRASTILTDREGAALGPAG